MIPFDHRTLRFIARIIPLSDQYELCLEVTRVTWPYQGPDRPKIEVIRWKPGFLPAYAPDRVRGDQHETRPNWEVEIDPNNDPDHGATVTTFAVVRVQ